MVLPPEGSGRDPSWSRGCERRPDRPPAELGPPLRDEELVKRRDFVPGATVLVVVLNLAVYGLMVANGVHAMEPTAAELLAWGANFGPRTLNGEWWRLVTATFVHSGLVHLGFNMYVLWDLGRAVERVFGTLGFALVYLVAGIGGSFASVMVNPLVASVGASGAVFGLAGALLAFALRNRRRLDPRIARRLPRSLFLFVVVNLAIGFTVPGIDNVGHVGGLATGWVGGLLVSPTVGPRGPVRPYTRYGILAAAGAGMCALVAMGVTLALGG
jgi:rhomboid protease GluP